jgi:hypothetical protein
VLRRTCAAALLVALAACGGDDSGGSPVASTGSTTSVTTIAGTATTPPDGPLTALLERSRLFEGSGQLYLTFVSHSSEVVEVGEVALRSALFEPVAPGGRILAVAASGDPISMPIPYGPAVCAGEEPDLGVRVVLAVDGEPTELDLGPAAPAIIRLHTLECAARAVRELVDVDFGADWAVVGPGRARGTITLTPRRDGDVRLQAVSASVVFSLEPTSDLSAPGGVVVDALAARCDAHALTESKKTFVFTLTFSVDGGDPVRVELVAADGPVRAALDQAIDDCVAARVPG